MTKSTLPTSYNLDTTVRPQDNFYGYVNNSWLAEHPIPASETRWDMFRKLNEGARQNMRRICTDLQTGDYATGTIEQQARDFYYAGMHMDDFTKDHMRLIHEFFNVIDAAALPVDLSGIIGTLHAAGLSGPWNTVVDADNLDSSQHTIRFYQSGLTLPDRDYYLDGADKMQAIRREFETHTKKVHVHFPVLAKDAEALWGSVYEIEDGLAQASRSSTELRDVENNYHKMSLDAVRKLYPNIDWKTYAIALGWKSTDNLSIDQPEFMAYVNDQLVTRPLEEWKTYLKWRVVIACYGSVNTKLAHLRFEFFGKVLGGSTEMMPQWKRTINAIDTAIGEGVGRLYAERFFSHSSKQQVLDMVETVRGIYRRRIQNLEWMSDETKKYALKKLSNIEVLIGYPDEWRDFTKLIVSRDSYLGNVLAAARFEKAFWLDRLSQPTSRKDWFMYAQTVNAYHDPNRLVICFPAAILQPPFFDPKADYAANMGGIGTVIGHELTHGFDDQGCMFDSEGNVRTWQTEAERKTFKQKAKIIIDQADNFEILPGLNLKGGLIIGESIADLGGLEIAFEALQDRLKLEKDGSEEQLASKRLFFINYARTECANTREEKLREYTLSDPHPGSIFRVNGMVCHINGFYEAFDVTHSDALYLSSDKRAKIW